MGLLHEEEVVKLAFDIWERARSKWRGLLVYALLNAAMRFATELIMHGTSSRGLRLYASLAAVAVGVYCLVQQWRLLTADQPGDETWPPLWS